MMRRDKYFSSSIGSRVSLFCSSGKLLTTTVGLAFGKKNSHTACKTLSSQVSPRREVLLYKQEHPTA